MRSEGRHEVSLAEDPSSELNVYATPLYVDGMTGTLKNAMDRSLPLLHPFFEIREGHCRHALREHAVKNGRAMLVSASGFIEMDSFDHSSVT